MNKDVEAMNEPLTRQDEQVSFGLLQAALRDAGCLLGGFSSTYGQFFVDVETGDGAVRAAGWVLDYEHGCMRHLLDYDGWIPVAMSCTAILATIEAEEIALSQRTWPEAPLYHVQRVLQKP